VLGGFNENLREGGRRTEQELPLTDHVHDSWARTQKSLGATRRGDDSGYMNAACLIVDGGLTAT
jgi:hypothetical protein